MLGYLPREILQSIFIYLDLPNIITISFICKLFRYLTYEDKRFLQKALVVPSYEQVSKKEYFARYTIFPGAEKYLDLVHCLIRAIKIKNLFLVEFFLKRVSKDNISVDEFGFLIELLVNYWNVDIFNVILSKFCLIYRMYYSSGLLQKLPRNEVKSYLAAHNMPPYSENKRYTHRYYKQILDLSWDVVMKAENQSIQYDLGLQGGYRIFINSALIDLKQVNDKWSSEIIELFKKED